MLVRLRFPPTLTEHWKRQRDICHCEIFRYFNACYILVLYVCWDIQRKFNSILSGQHISTTNTIHFIYLDFFSCLFRFGILFAWAYQ